MRAFFLSGQKLRYDGAGPRGERQYRAVSTLEDDAMRKFSSFNSNAPGAFIDFKLSPTLTALSPLGAAVPFASETSGLKPEAKVAGVHLNTEGFLDVLSADFGRALQDLAVTLADLRRLAILGDLPVLLENPTTLRVRFPGVDADTLDRLCDDLGVQRGVVGEDADFGVAAGVPMALKFPFAPDAPKSFSVRSLREYMFDESSSLGDDDFVREVFMDEMAENPWLSDPEGYETMSQETMSHARSSGSSRRKIMKDWRESTGSWKNVTPRKAVLVGFKPDWSHLILKANHIKTNDLHSFVQPLIRYQTSFALHQELTIN